MANRISNRKNLANSGTMAFPPQRAIIPPPIVYTPITTEAAQPPSRSNVNQRTETATAFVGQFPDPA